MMKKTNLLMIGTVTSNSQSKLFVDSGITPGPAEIVQKYLISGLCHTDIKQIDIISAPRIPAYPKSPIMRVTEEDWNIERAKIHSIGFNNYIGIGFLDREREIQKAAIEWGDKNKDELKIVLIYSMHSPFLKAANSIKKKYPDTVVALIVPDLPQYMATYKGIKYVLKKMDMHRIDKLIDCVDKYVLYTKHMADYFQLSKGKWTVMEGLMDVSKIEDNKINKEREKPICLYAGRLDVRYAIDKLIEAFSDIPEAELHLYGNSSDAEKLSFVIDKYSNVSYMGSLSQDDVFQKMREANLLLNPRPTNIELAKYSCPSKTFEYMASGTPVLMTKLPGLPEEYYPFLFFFDEETVSGFRDGIKKVLSLSNKELSRKGLEAQKFLKNQKEATAQVYRVMSFIFEK